MPSPTERRTLAPIFDEIVSVAGVRVEVSKETDSVLLRFEYSNRQAESDGLFKTPWLSVPNGLLDDVIKLLQQERKNLD
jgi:hypothetical protein